MFADRELAPRIAMGVFFAALLAYLVNGSVTPINPDSVPNAFLPASILGDGDLAFSPFEAPFMFVWKAKAGGDAAAANVEVDVTAWQQVPPGSRKSFAQHYQEGRLLFAGPKYYLIRTVRERGATGEPLFVGAFGPLPGLMALPLAALASWAGVPLWQNAAATWMLAKLTAACLAAASVAFIYLIAAYFLPRTPAIVLAAAYGLGTCLWAVSSHSLWQQTPEIFFLSLGILCLVRLPGAWLRGAASGLAFSAGAACRPTAALVALAAAGALALSDRRALGAFVVAACPVAAAVLAYNIYYFGSPFELAQLAAGARVAQYKTGSAEVWQTPLWLGAAGLLLSPSRGLLVYSPFLAVAALGAVRAWQDARYAPLRFLGPAVLALWIPAFLWFDWWGGWSYGYRPIVDSVPLLAVLCIPAMQPVLERPLRRAAFAACVAWSVLVQALGALAYSPWGWNAKLVDSAGLRADIDRPEYRERLWSFRDWQIGYLIANFSEARADRRAIIAY